MSTKSKISRLKSNIDILIENNNKLLIDKSNIAQSITSKGVEVPEDAKLEDFSELIDSIPEPGIPENTVNSLFDIINGEIIEGNYIQKSNETIDSKENIRLAIVDKGVEVAENTPLSQYSGKIGEIVSGTGGNIPVHFFDSATGKIIDTVCVKLGEDATPPTPPTHEYLTFYGWKGDYTNIQKESWAAAMYDTTDPDSNYVFITIDSAANLTLTFYFWKDAYSNVLTIDWGDGTTSSTTNLGNLNFSHTFPSVGNYVIKLTSAVAVGVGNTGNINIFNNTTPTSTLRCIVRRFYFNSKAKIQAYCQGNNDSLDAVVFSRNINLSINNGLPYCHTIRYISIPDTVTSMGNNFFTGNYGIEVLLLSNNITTSNSLISSGDRAISYLSIPPNLTYANYLFMGTLVRDVYLPDSVISLTYTFYDSRHINTIRIGPNVTSIDSNAFLQCDALRVIKIDRNIPPAVTSQTFNSSTFRVAAKIYVPDSALETYRSATYWSAIADRIRPISELG